MLNLNLTLPVMMVLFLVFAWLMNLVFFGPVTRALAERKAYVARQKEQANDALGRLKALQEDYDARLRAAHAESQDAIQAAIKEAELKRQALLEGVKADVAKEVAAARAAIREERSNAVASLSHEVGPFAELIARKAFGSSPALSNAGGHES